MMTQTHQMDTAFYQSFPIMTARADIAARVEGVLSHPRLVTTKWLRTVPAAMDELLAEMPPACVIDFASPEFDAFALLEGIHEDAWLMQTGIIAIHASGEAADRLDALQGHNLIIALPENRIEANLPTVMRIVKSNRRLLVHRGLREALIDNFTASFELNNDVTEARCFANLVCNFLFNSGKVDNTGKRQVQLAITEMLMNAIEHGNCGISHEQKTGWLESGRDIQELIAERMMQKQYNGTRVGFEYSVMEDRASFCVTDQGEGFDWRSLQDPAEEENLLALHGRGIAMTRMSVTNLAYNEKGNQVRFEIPLDSQEQPLTPKLFQGQPARRVNAGEEVMREGDESDNVYYIASGRYDVIANGHPVYRLTPDDIFIGEMAFLLGGRRSATVVAATDGLLVPIGKRELLLKIRENPHYGLFLARLMAERLASQNANAGNGEEEVLL